MKNSKRESRIHSGRLALALLALSVAVACGAGAAGAEPRGRVSGVVANAKTGEPIAGAYVAIDHSGDAGGTNLERFRKQGIYVTTETDAEGRFVLDGVAFLETHPFMATRPGFVRHEQTIALRESDPEIDVRIDLRPAATIHVKVVDAAGDLLQHPAVIRLEAEDRRVFPPMQADWPTPSYRVESTEGGVFAFGELDTGVFTVDVIRVAGPETVYHGGVSDLEVEAGETKEVKVVPANHQTVLTLDVADDPHQKPEMPSLVFMSRIPGLLLWCDGKLHHPEDHRLGRVQYNALIEGMARPDSLRDARHTVRGLPPGVYALFVVTVGTYDGFKNAGVYLRGAKVEIRRDCDVTVEIPWTEPRGVARANLWSFNKRVRPEARPYTGQELCELITARTGPRLSLVAYPPIHDERVTLDAGEMSVWELLEAVYLDTGWRIAEGSAGQEGRQQTLILGPKSMEEETWLAIVLMILASGLNCFLTR